MSKSKLTKCDGNYLATPPQRDTFRPTSVTLSSSTCKGKGEGSQKRTTNVSVSVQWFKALLTDDEVSDHEQLPGNQEEFNDGNTTANVPMDFLDLENSSSERLYETHSVIWV